MVMNEAWKKTMAQLFQWQNRCMVNGPIDEIAAFFGEDRLAQREIHRLRRTQEQQKDRGIKHAKSEIRIKPLNIEQKADDVNVKLNLYQSFTYQLKAETVKEERCEQRYFKLRDQGGKWKVVDEDGVREGLPFEQKELPLWIGRPSNPLPARIASMPLINQEMLRQSSYSRARAYERHKAVRYADAWWNSYNPDYREFSVDCTNYVSQSLFAGGAPMNQAGQRDRGWWYKHAGGAADQWSYSWAVAHSLRWYLPTSGQGLQGKEVSSAGELALGDIICYDFDGDGKWQHNTIVTAIDASGQPLVNAHTTNSYHRYWDYRDSYAHTSATKYKFFKIADEF
jgi:hypothetical protein